MAGGMGSPRQMPATVQPQQQQQELDPFGALWTTGNFTSCESPVFDFIFLLAFAVAAWNLPIHFNTYILKGRKIANFSRIFFF